MASYLINIKYTSFLIKIFQLEERTGEASAKEVLDRETSPYIYSSTEAGSEPSLGQ